MDSLLELSVELLLSHFRAIFHQSLLNLRFEEPLSESQLDTLRSLIKRRLEREPLQYITGSCEFYGREFSVNKHVLIPRPETERLIDIALEKMKGVDSPSILDVGTGSGCIATTLAIEVPSAKILGIDLSPEALKVSEENKEKLALFLHKYLAFCLNTRLPS